MTAWFSSAGQVILNLFASLANEAKKRYNKNYAYNFIHHFSITGCYSFQLALDHHHIDFGQRSIILYDY